MAASTSFTFDPQNPVPTIAGTTYEYFYGSAPCRTKTWTEFKVPDEAIGCGFHEAVRGVLSHHMVIREGKIANYHPYPPTPWNASPRDSFGTSGPLSATTLATLMHADFAHRRTALATASREAVLASDDVAADESFFD